MKTSFAPFQQKGGKTPGIRMTIFALIAAACTTLSSAVIATPKTETNIITTPMVEASSRFFDKVYLAEGANFAAYRKVFVEPGEVSFSDHWEREHRTDVSDSYKSGIREKYGALLQEQLKKAYAKSERYRVVEDKSEADLILRPVLENLNIFGPERSPGLTRTYVYRAGNATFNLLLVDADTGDAVAKFVDHRETRESPGLVLERANRVTNYRDFRMLMQKWSREVVEYSSEEQV